MAKHNPLSLPTKHLKLPATPKPHPTHNPGYAPATQDVANLSRPEYSRHAEMQPAQPMGGRPHRVGPTPDPTKKNRRSSPSESLARRMRMSG